ncbi:hypothetical protein RvVAR031_29610 [Agrobacterium vitis]|nr:hypothetical protein RvVAR031_29610 [Agrobacterium vitis]
MISLDKGVDVKEGDWLIIEQGSSSSITVRRESNFVGFYENPNAEFLSNLSKSGGVAGGIVRRIMKLSRKAEVSFC